MDPIADMLNTIKIATQMGKSSVSISHSKIKFAIANILEKEGYVKSVAVSNDKSFGKRLEIGISYKNLPDKKKRSKLNEVSRVSKPSRRIYKSAKDLIPVNQGHGISVISTNKGLMTDKQARKDKVGGEVLFKIW